MTQPGGVAEGQQRIGGMAAEVSNSNEMTFKWSQVDCTLDQVCHHHHHQGSHGSMKTEASIRGSLFVTTPNFMAIVALGRISEGLSNEHKLAT